MRGAHWERGGQKNMQVSPLILNTSDLCTHKHRPLDLCTHEHVIRTLYTQIYIIALLPVWHQPRTYRQNLVSKSPLSLKICGISSQCPVFPQLLSGCVCPSIYLYASIFPSSFKLCLYDLSPVYICYLTGAYCNIL